MKKSLLFVICLSSFYYTQSQNFESILLAADDASLLAQNYLNPAAKSLMFSANGGWFTTAKTHKVLGLDLTFSANASIVPDNQQTFNFVASDYQYLSIAGGSTELPTIMSDDATDRELQVRIPNDNGTFKIATLTLPGGIAGDLPLNAVPMPMVQLGVGLPTNTDLKIRFVPNLNVDDDLETGMLGIGLQHNITQYLGLNEGSPLNLSVLGAFTRINATYAINDDDPSDSISVTNGQTDFKFNTYTVQALASLDFKLFTFYGSIGYNSGDTRLQVNGTYNLNYDLEDSNGNNLGSVQDQVIDPVQLDFDIDGMRATIGGRFNLGFFKLFADYSIQEYNTASAGIAFSFR